MIRPMPAAILRSASPPSMPAIPPRRTNSLPTPRSFGARPTRICLSFGAFKRDFPPGADEGYASPFASRELGCGTMTAAFRKLSGSRLCSSVWRAAWTASLGLFFLAALARENPVRYLRFDEVQETLRRNADSGLPGSEIEGSERWDAWIRARDGEVRGRIDRGIEDSISNLILFGTSFTSLPRVESVEFAAAESGELRPATIARIHALALALGSSAKNERVRFVGDLLARKGIGKNSEESYFTENLQRFIAEQAAYQKKLEDAANDKDPSAVYLAREKITDETNPFIL